MYNHIERVRDVLDRRIRELDDRGVIKLTEYAAALLEGETHLFHQRELVEHRLPHKPRAMQTQPRHSDGILNLTGASDGELEGAALDGDPHED